MEALEIRIEIWKESGKWYGIETAVVDSIDNIDKLLMNYGKYNGMFATVSYLTEDDYYQPYRLFKL